MGGPDNWPHFFNIPYLDNENQKESGLYWLENNQLDGKYLAKYHYFNINTIKMVRRPYQAQIDLENNQFARLTKFNCLCYFYKVTEIQNLYFWSIQVYAFWVNIWIFSAELYFNSPIGSFQPVNNMLGQTLGGPKMNIGEFYVIAILWHYFVDMRKKIFFD